MIISVGIRIDIEIKFEKDERLSYLDKGARVGAFTLSCKDGKPIVLPGGVMAVYDDGDHKTLSISQVVGILEEFDTESIGNRITAKIWQTGPDENGCDELIFDNKEMKIFVDDMEVARYNDITVALQEPKYFDRITLC